MKNIQFIAFFLLFSMALHAQYDFKETKRIQCTDVKSQGRTGTCWSFATSSFLESEVSRKLGKDVDLSEMYIVKQIYKDKARNYILRQGKANFSQGSLGHDVIRIVGMKGMMTEQAFSGFTFNKKMYDHGEMEDGLKGFLDGVRSQKNITPLWDDAVDAILDIYMGAEPANFKYDGKVYSPKSFANHVGISADDYISITSFTHHPFYEKFILEIPDNYSNGPFYNIPMDDMVKVIDEAIEKGYTVAWDGDVSEKGFGRKEGIAILPEEVTEDMFDNPVKEIEVTQELRQENFESYATTDDHLMHLIGTAKDKDGNEYYIIKNSWGETNAFGGYLYMSKAYVQMKTVGIMVNKEALNKSLADKISL